MPLIDTNLVVRYYCDEAAGGVGPSHLLDESGVGSDFDLAINYETNRAEFNEVSGNRNWYITDGNFGTGPVANKAINDSSDKVRDALDGVQKLTVELVANIIEGFSSVGRIFGITGSGDEGAIMLCHDNGTDDTEGYVRFEENDREQFAWTKGERAVWHFVVDSTQADAANRIKVYKNGSLHTSTQSVDVVQNSTLDIEVSSFLCIGNRANDGSRGVEDAKIFYAALYSSDFSAQDCSDNYDVLILDDDTPAVGAVVSIHHILNQ